MTNSPLYWLAKRYRHNTLAKWMVLLADVGLTVLAFAVSELFIGYLDGPSLDFLSSLVRLSVVLAVTTVVFLIVGSYRGILRHTGLNDVMKIMFECSISLVTLLLISFLNRLFNIADTIYLPFYPEIVIAMPVLSVFMIYLRLFCQYFYNNYLRRRRRPRAVVIYGAGAVCALAANVLQQDQQYAYEIKAYIDDDSQKSNQLLNGVRVFTSVEVLNDHFVQRNGVEMLLLAIPSLRQSLKQEIVNRGLDLGLVVKTIPHAKTWIDGSFASTQIEDIKIEDLLERESISLDNANVHRALDGKCVLVTGAAGSIGSEICRQVLRHNPSSVVMLDQAESAMYDLQFELRNTPAFEHVRQRMVFVIANVKDERRIEDIFAQHSPQVVFHAAAYKHVPFMEENAYEASFVNVYGTKVVADCAIRHGAEKFVMISTDKAVNPTNVMGTTKRMAEIYVQSHSTDRTHFVTTRFGNVLGSNGSVIPLFKKQLAAGGPLTVTHRDIIRYFMTIPEACSLVLEAGAIGTGGDIFVFDMGQPVKIYDLAQRMIRLSGRKGIEIVETGLRPGEKLYEELLASFEDTVPTENPKILHAKVRQYSATEVDEAYERFFQTMNTMDDMAIVAAMKQIVPEYISNNSKYCSLDKK